MTHLPFINFHAHRAAQPGEFVVQDGLHTWGIHPWYAAQAKQPAQPPAEGLLAIGECGLDRLCATPWDAQLEAFRRCIVLSEERSLPLILHSVRATADCLLLRRRLGARQPWVFHGFRGSARKLAEPLAAGLYISFGIHFQADALVTCPPERLLLETDTDPLPIADLYARVAQLRGITIEQLCALQAANYRRLFGAQPR